MYRLDRCATVALQSNTSTALCTRTFESVTKVVCLSGFRRFSLLGNTKSGVGDSLDNLKANLLHTVETKTASTAI